MMFKSASAGFAMCILISLVGCKGEGEDPIDDNFDKKAMLESISNNVASPAYQAWGDEMTNLESAFAAFADAPNSSQLAALQEAFLNAYGKWNRCAVFEIGPAAEVNLRKRINTFPSDTAQIEANITSGAYDLDEPKNTDAKGFAALEYLLFSNETALLNSMDRRDYASALLAEMMEYADELDSDWSTYHSEFINLTSSSAGSSISNLVNEINFEFELFKNARIGIPLGKKTLGVTQVHKLEGYYAGHASELATENLRGIKSAFLGNTSIGLDDYLDKLNATKDGQKLSKAIVDLFDQIEDDLAAYNLEHEIENSPENLEAMYNRIEQLVVLLKVDMPSQLGVQITYQDNDGD